MSTTAAPEVEGFRIEVDGLRADLVLDQPDRLNPLSTQTLLDLETAARWIDDQRDVRVVVVRGEGRAFSAGADLASFQAAAEPGDVHADADAGRRMADAVEAMRAVAIAQVHGHCVGGGLVLAAACDLRIAATGTQFSIPEVDLGIPLAWGGIPRLVREIGPAATKELVMTCRRFDADEAKQLGFLNRVVDTDALVATVDDLAASLAAKPAFAVAMTKSATNAVTANATAMASTWADAAQLTHGLRDPEGRAAARAYVERVRER